ncbi:MAG: chorismate mutase [Clostridiales bacterium GWB2_37_7]|nr:MAG: chorismate mutase [Clostridiales bacterium GWB2_37_7]
MVSIRGATTIDRDIPEELLSGTTELLKDIITVNKLDLNKINAIFFTCTQDLISAYPAKAARDMGITQSSLMCLQEMYVENSLAKCIRVCIFYDDDHISDHVKHVYLKNALFLRPDLSK